MADSKISALTDGNPAQSGDEIPIARGGANYKITASSIASLGGDVDGPASSVDNQIALFDSTTGKLIKAATTSGVLKATSGVVAAATSGTDYVAPAGAFSGLSWQSVQTTGFTAVAFRAYPCNTTSAAFTVTLPASPSAGDQITLTDYAGTFAANNLTINPNGGKVNGSASNYVVSQNRWSFQLVYVDSTQGWLISGTTNLYIPPPLSFDYLIVAGGGGGGGNSSPSVAGGGGGGAGGYRTGTGLSVTAGSAYTITVGGGGPRATIGFDSSIAGPSPFSTITSTGGGKGGENTTAGGNGGSGGGGGGNGSAVGNGNTPSTSPSQGNNGGSGSSTSNWAGGGGGGAGAIGGSSTGTIPGTPGGTGGSGSASSITGSSVTYAGGGGGSSYDGTVASGGSGGGGAGGRFTPSTAAVAGTANTGGGGGGGTSSNGGAGGSGVVIIAYPAIYAAAAATTGSPTVTVSGGNRIYTFTGNGTITW